MKNTEKSVLDPSKKPPLPPTSLIIPLDVLINALTMKAPTLQLYHMNLPSLPPLLLPTMTRPPSSPHHTPLMITTPPRNPKTSLPLKNLPVPLTKWKLPPTKKYGPASLTIHLIRRENVTITPLSTPVFLIFLILILIRMLFCVSFGLILTTYYLNTLSPLYPDSLQSIPFLHIDSVFKSPKYLFSYIYKGLAMCQLRLGLKALALA